MATDTKAPSHPPMPPTSQPPRKPDDEDNERRIYRNVAVCTRDPIPWIIGRLELGRADISRLQSSGIPILLGHVPNEVMGAVMAVRESADVWRSDWTIPKISATRDTRDRMDTNLLKGISVGGLLQWDSLEITNEDEVNNPDEWIFRADWVMLEQSLTAIPADVRAGIDRTMIARTGPIPDLFIGPDNGIYTPETPEIRQRLDSLMRQHNQNVSIRREQTMTTKPLEQTVSQDLIEKAIADQLQRNESLKALTEVPAKLDKIAADAEAESERNMEYRAKLDKLQYQPNGQTLQLGNWSPGDAIINLGVVMRLTRQEDGILPPIDANTITTMEESVVERAELGKAGRDVLARLPWEALAERERQLQFQRAAMSDAAGARPVMIDVLGNGGLVLSSFSPILGRMDVRLGVEGAQKAPWATSQPTAVAGAEGADIAVTNLVLDNVEYLPKSLASAYEITTALRGVDDGTFQSIAMMAIRDVLLDQLTGQALVGGGANQISGLWGLTGVQETSYGAAQNDFTRQDALDFLDNVRLSKTDGGLYTGVLSTTLWKLAESVLRGGASSDAYLLENAGMMGQGMMENGQGMMGRMEGEAMYHYADLSPTGITDSGLFFKGDKVLIWIWGGSMNLELIPQLARKDTYRMVLEANMVCQRPAQNVSRLRQT